MNPPDRHPRSSGQRLFFALWPAAMLQSRIFNYAQSLKISSARFVPVDNLHMTLLFLGQVEAGQQHCLEQALNSLRLPGFELHFGQAVFRRRQRLLWLEPASRPDALLRLVAALRQIASDCGLKTESRPFLAHISLFHKLAQAPPDLAAPEFIWPVQDFALVASKTLPAGARYRIVKKWSLAG